MADQLNQIPTSSEPIGTFGDKEIPVKVSSVWYKFFASVSSVFSGGGGGTGASALLDTIGDVIGGMLARFGDGWHEFVATQPNEIPVMNPGTPVILKTVSQLLDLIGGTQGEVLYRGVAGWQVLAPVAGGYFQSQGPGADPVYAASTSGNSVATGLVAAGTTQGTALVLTRNWNEIITTPVNSGVTLAALGAGQPGKVWNEGANPLNVYPPVGGQIDALGVNNPYILAAGKCQELDQLAAGFWRSTQLG